MAPTALTVHANRPLRDLANELADEQIGALPIVGTPLLYLLRGGAEVSDITLLRLYDLHTKLLPVLLVALVGVHVITVRLIGFADVMGSRKFHAFYPCIR